ncbi:hypothetical protein SEEE4220_15044 [Salmonella enterica subsp. enterica serovar Enteritidis str. 543463 42-20]|nr:hypothetical protein SEEE4220_15044 [Salmonella enterica subsp. enterica serovar Enteritidis str. 543463 42-20]
MRLISHKFSDLINLDVRKGGAENAKRGNYRDFSSAIPVRRYATVNLLAAYSTSRRKSVQF